MNLTIHVDGGSRGNPGPAAIGVAIQDTDTQQVVHEAGYYIGKATNNVAEYRALIRALELAQQYHAKEVNIRCDSQLVVMQVTGRYKVKSPDLKELHQQVQMLVRRFDSWQISHVYRHLNSCADDLVNMALDAKADVILASLPSASSHPKSRGASSPLFDDPAQQAQPRGQSPQWIASVTSEPETPWEGGCERGQRFTFGPTTPKGMCVHAAQAMFALSPTTDMEGQGPRATIRCPQCGCTLSIEMKT